MNIYESMNKAFDVELNKVPTVKNSSKLNESVEEKPAVEFKAIEIPAPFNTYYRTLQPEEYEDMIGCSYEECATDDAADYGVDEIQYIIAQDNYKEDLQDAGMEILSVYKDGDVIGVGQEVGGRLFPVDYIDIKDYISECVQPVAEAVKSPLQKLQQKYPELEASSESAVDNSIKKDDIKPDSPMDKLVKKYSELINEAKKRDLWSEVYGKLTMDGEQIQKGKTTQFNTGAGYDNTSQISTDPQTGAICVGANTLEELRPAADVAIKYKDQGVSYKMCRGSKNDKWAYSIKIQIPGVDMDECAEVSVEDVKEDVKCEGLSPIEKLKKAYPELNLD